MHLLFVPCMLLHRPSTLFLSLKSASSSRFRLRRWAQYCDTRDSKKSFSRLRTTPHMCPAVQTLPLRISLLSEVKFKNEMFLYISPCLMYFSGSDNFWSVRPDARHVRKTVKKNVHNYAARTYALAYAQPRYRASRIVVEREPKSKFFEHVRTSANH